MRLIECVPNFSEGRNAAAIGRIVDAIRAVADVEVLHVDPGRDTNRTVVTFVGAPEAVEEAAFRGIEAAASVIDMRRHKGEHPRIGATDVCPFIPISDVTIEECIALSDRVAERVGRELEIPVYLYAKSARRPERVRLPDIRRGEYEGLAAKLADPAFAPDYGPARFNPGAGATVVGARQFMIAYNVNLDTNDPAVANDIALTIRARGRARRDANGAAVRDRGERLVRDPGRLAHCQAMGWFLKDHGCAQVSMNLHDFRSTGLELAYEVTADEARKRGVEVTGSELVGMVPREALVQAGLFYLRKAGRSVEMPEREVIQAAVDSLGLNDLSPFVVDDRVIEYKLAREQPGRLVTMTVKELSDAVATGPVPAGGSVAALCATMAAALTGMVTAAAGRKADAAGDGFRDSGSGQPAGAPDELSSEEIAHNAGRLRERLLALVDEDAEAYRAVIAATRLPRSASPEIAARRGAKAQAMKRAIEVPLEVLRLAAAVCALARQVLSAAPVAVKADATAAAIQAAAAADVAHLNITVNLLGVEDLTFAREVQTEAASLIASVRKNRKAAKTSMDRALRHRPANPGGAR